MKVADETLHARIELFDSPHATVPFIQYIRHIVLVIDTNVKLDDENIVPSREFLSKLTYAHTLELREFNFHPAWCPIKPVVSLLAPIQPRIETLQMWDCDIEKHHELFQIIRPCHKLTTVLFRNTRWIGEQDYSYKPPPSDNEPRIKLRSEGVV